MSSILQVFLSLCKITLPAAGLILGMILLRALLIKWTPRWAVMLLWLAVALRLLIPVSVEVPGLSVPRFPSGEVSVETDTVLEWGTDGNGEVLSPAPPQIVTPSDTLAPSADINTTLQYAGAILWLLGVVSLLLYVLINYVRLAARMARGVPYTPACTDEIPMSVPRGVSIKQCDEVTSPFIMGIFSPCIYLPYGLDGGTETCVLAHELAHIRRGDHILKLAAFALVIVHWFNPLVWVAWMLYCRDTEVACDERAVKDMTLEERKTYAVALLSFLPAKKRTEASAYAPLSPCLW